MSNNTDEIGGPTRPRRPPAVATAPDPFVVVSHHRSGSNFLTELLWRHPSLQVLTEPLAQHLDVFVHRDLEVWPTGMGPRRDVVKALSSPFAVRYLRDLRRWLQHQPGRGFKETRLAEKVDWFASAVTPVQIVIGVRDPRAVTASILRRPHLVDYWIPTTLLTHIPSTIDKDRASRDVVYRSAVMWAYRYARLLNRPGHTGPDLVVQTETLLREPSWTLRALTGFLGVAEFDYTTTLDELWAEGNGNCYSTRRAPADVIDGWRRVLSRTDSDTIRDVCGDLMEPLGYT